jgi:F-type H+-transporting ATPase subunit b
MGLARIVCLTAMLFGVLGFPALGLAADNIEERLHHAEAEFERTAHSDTEHSAAGSDPLAVDPDLAIWTAVVFFLLLAVLWKFAWGPIVASLEKREHSIAHDISDAKRQREEADSLVVKYEARLAAAGDEVRGILDEARRNGEGVKQSILAEAKQAAESERLRSLHDIELATDAALRSLAERSAQLAVDLAGKIVRLNLTPADHANLVNEAVDKFSVTPSKN